MSSTSEIVNRRLAAQRLTGRRLSSASEVVRELCAVQAQDYLGAKWALAQRTTGVTDAEVEAEFTRGAMLRTHVLRPTWHFVAPEDLRWMLKLTGPRVNRIMDNYGRKLGLTAAVYGRSLAVIAKALTGGKHLMRSEIATKLERAKIRVTGGQTLARIMMRAETDGLVTSGPRRGKQFTYA
ncbi:MAG: crosslink repair DNA glycosylase YcaQ family protein, partial [Gemmatimonadota bacterium]